MIKTRLIKLISASAVFLCFSVYADAVSELQQMFAKHSSMSASFTQEVTKSNGEVISSAEGTLAIKKPDSLMMHTVSPDEQVLFTKGKDVYFYDPFINQVTIFDKKDLYTSPFLLLTSNRSDIWNQYTVTKESGKYRLVPKKKADIKELSLKFNGEDISSISIRLMDGNINTYNLTGIRYTVENDAFSYTIPEDAQIDDERKSN